MTPGDDATSAPHPTVTEPARAPRKASMARAFCSFRRKQQKLVAYAFILVVTGLLASRMYRHVTTFDLEDEMPEDGTELYDKAMNDYGVNVEDAVDADLDTKGLTANKTGTPDVSGNLAKLNAELEELDELPSASITEIDNKKAQLSHRVLTLWQMEQKAPKEEKSLIEEKDICERYNKEARQPRTNITGVWSKLNYCPVDDVTLVTQAHANKVDRIIELAKHWDGPMSIAVYIGNDDILDFTTKIGADDNIMRRKNIDFHLVAESGEFYPINLLRNMALKNARTAFVLLVDVDLLPSQGLHSYLKSVLESGVMQGSKVLVVSVFEYPKESNVQEHPRDKAELIHQLEEGHIKPFQKNTDEYKSQMNKLASSYAIWYSWKWFPTMGPVDYRRWLDETKPYTVQYKDGFEPYIVMERNKVPAYDQSFMGRYGNKNSHLMEVWAKGYEFIVLPDCFMVHYPHHIQWKTPYMHCSVRAKQKFVERLKTQYNIAKVP